MSCHSRRVLFVLLTLIVVVSAVWLDEGRAQDKKEEVKEAPIVAPAGMPPRPSTDAGMNPDGFLNGGVNLPKDNKGRGKTIEAAIDYINDENWTIAIERLQKLLDIDEDVYVRLKRKNAEGKEVYVWVSAKHEANRLVGSLPPAGLDFYKTTYGATAAALLKKAKQNGDPRLLAEIMKKYAHTDAGGEAIQLLAAYHLDRGNYPSALHCYSRLFSRQGADKLPVEVIAKAWSAARMSPTSGAAASTALTGNTIAAKELWKQLHERTRELKFGAPNISLQEFEEYVTKLERPNFNNNATDALVFRASANRANQLVGGPAFMAATWRQSMLHDPQSPALAHINKAMGLMQSRNQPIVSAFSPITATLTNGNTRKPLLVYKNYWGLVARNLKTGSLEWHSPSEWSVEHLLDPHTESRKQQFMHNGLNFYITQNQYPQILFENSTVSTLSTDGQFVYVVEDLAVPPPQTANVNMGFNPNQGNHNNYGPDILDAIQHSRLQAIELKSGKLVWDSKENREEKKGPLADCYILGAPLPLGGKLYVLTEKAQELRLVCFEMIEIPIPTGKTYTVRVVSTQTLGTTTEKMEQGVIRRTTAAHLAYGEGILVCPTNSGAVFGINLLENSLVWAYPYREKSDQPRQPQPQVQMLRGGRRGGIWIQGPNGMAVMPLSGHENLWKASAPVIADGKVVFTAPDARSLHCINLRDGSLVWRKPKLAEDLYLGNVYNGKVLIVGKKNVRGLSLATGETLWTLDTGMPSGQGIGSDNVYYLPLKEAGRSKEPQIAGIDMDTGKISKSSKSRPRTPGSNDLDVPGNLLFYDGDVISVTPQEVVAYQQLKVKIAEMDDRIAKNPNDPIGLTERGDLRLDKGDLAGAIEDLSTALKNKPDQQTRARARSKLYDTLTVYISDHFNDAEQYLQEYEELCQVDMEGATAKDRAEREAEQRRRRATYLWLVGKGREEQGRLVEAFEKYQRFGAEAGKEQELVPAVDERQVRAAPDVWSRGRIVAMMAKAKPEHREPLEKLIAGKWDKLRQTNDLNELRQFVRMFGSVSTAGKEARLQLAERLMEQKDSADEHPLLEAEMELNQFRTGQHSPELAARATEALARLYTRKGLLEDAAYCYRKLGNDYAKVLIRDGKTGRQIYDDEAATDKRLLPYLDETEPLGGVKLKAKRENDNFSKAMPGHGRLFQFEHSGENLPFFRHHLVGLLDPSNEFKLLDRTQVDDDKAPKEIWSKKLSASMFRMMTAQVLGQNQPNNFNPNLNNQNHNARFPYRTVGHLIVLPVGEMVFGIDPVNHHVVWEKNLASGGSGPISNQLDPQHPPVVDPRDGTALLTYKDGWAQRLGQVGSFEGQTVCVQTRDALTALDPLTGRTLWSRSDVSRRNYIFADEEYVFVVELDNLNNNPHATRVFRATDGISVKAPDFTALFSKRQQIFGRNILVTEVGKGSRVLVRLYDALTGQDVWKQSYPARSLVTRGEDPHFTGIVEPEGKVHIVDLRTRKEVMTGQMDNPSEHLRNVQAIHLLLDRKNFYLACQAPSQVVNAGNPFGNISVSNVMTNLGMRTVPVNGRLYAFERTTGEVAWHAEAKNQMLVLDQFQELPVVLLTARHMVMTPGRQQWVAALLSIEKRGGRILFEGKDLANAPNFFGVRVDARARTIDFLSANMKLTHYPDPVKTADAGKSVPETSTPPTPVTKPRPPLGGRINRSPIDRVRIREIADPPSVR